MQYQIHTANQWLCDIVALERGIFRQEFIQYNAHIQLKKVVKCVLTPIATDDPPVYLLETNKSAILIINNDYDFDRGNINSNVVIHDPYEIMR